MASNEKCGKVFLTQKGLTIFHCLLCENKYNEIQNFGIHIIDKHFTPDDDFEVDDLLPDIPDIMLEECASNMETLNNCAFESDEEDSKSNSSSEEKINDIELLDDDQQDKQCGEVDLTLEGMLIFRCTLCDNIYEGVREFDQHVICEHHSTEVLEEVEFEMLWPDKDADNTDNFNEIEERIEFELLTEDSLHDKETSTTINEKIQENTNAKKGQRQKKPIPKWKQIFETFECPTTNEEKYKCRLCGVVIRDKSNTHNHIKRVHEQTKPHKCPECPKHFQFKTELRIHIRQHTGERPYLCMECGMTFISASKLHRHREENHKKDVRDKICQTCGKSFYTMRRLRAHHVTHRQERPFKCEVCDATFKINTTLKTHMRIHEDKRQFKCNICSASYNYKSILKSHIKAKHGLATETLQFYK